MVSAVNIQQARDAMGLDSAQGSGGSGGAPDMQQLMVMLSQLLEMFAQQNGGGGNAPQGQGGGAQGGGAQGAGAGASAGGGTNGGNDGGAKAPPKDPSQQPNNGQPGGGGNVAANGTGTGTDTGSRVGAKDSTSRNGANAGKGGDSAKGAQPTATSSAPEATATPKGSGAKSLDEAAKNTKPKNVAVLRGDEKQSDAKVKSQADFGRLVDKTAKEYGLDPNLLRAEMEKESNAFTKGYEQAMSKEGDLDRQGEGNTSIGIGQISRNFLDGGEWSDEGPNNPRAGGESVSTEQYNSSVTTQVRLMASNLSMRAQDHGGLEGGLAFYVNGTSDTSQAKAQDYLQGIDEYMNDAGITEVGR